MTHAATCHDSSWHQVERTGVTPGNIKIGGFLEQLGQGALAGLSEAGAQPIKQLGLTDT